jgi:hypothetical protein
VTIIAGFKSYEGVVLCADTQETREHAKRKVSKVRFEPRNIHGLEIHHSNLAAAFCGAGDGPFIDKLIEEAWKAAKDSSSLDEACENIKGSIEYQHEKFGKIYQPGFVPETQLIFGIKMDGDSKLFTSLGPVVNEKDGYDSGGIGYYMADFLAGRMYKDHLTVRQCVILAAYILYQAKEHVEGCGGDSQIVVLRERESSGFVDWRRIEAITKLLSHADHEIGDLLLTSANLDITDEKLKETIDLSISFLHIFRNNGKEELERSEEVDGYTAAALGVTPDKTDSLGLPMSSDDQTSEDQP